MSTILLSLKVNLSVPATELYLVSRMAIDPDHPAERAYLQALGHKLNLQPELIAHLEHQVAATNT